MSLEEFFEDLSLMRSNAELFNGLQSEIAQKARDLEGYARGLLEGQKGDISNFEMLVSENRGSKLI